MRDLRLHNDSASVIRIEGATENNLANISIDIPKYCLVVMTGASGSGKSSLAFDTIYMEARRRFLDTLSVYARQFVGELKKPKVKRITGLTPSIAVVQATAVNNPRSTVGTITEVYDFMRLLWGRAGTQLCPHCQIEVSASSVQEMQRRLMALPPQTRIVMFAPMVQQRKGMHEQLLARLKADGFSRVRVDGEIQLLAELGQLRQTVRHDIDLLIDRLVIEPKSEARLSASLLLALKYGEGRCVIERELEGKQTQTIVLSEHASCARCSLSFPDLNPNMLAYNSPHGACDKCQGLGVELRIRRDWLIGDTSLPLIGKDNAQMAFLPLLDVEDSEAMEELKKELARLCKKHGIKASEPWSTQPTAKREAFINEIAKFFDTLLAKDPSDTLALQIMQFVEEVACEACEGTRLKPHARSVVFAGERLETVNDMTIDKALDFFEHLDLDTRSARIARDIMGPLLERLRFVKRVGLSYLQLARGATTLSGGEAQRIRLAGLLGNGLTAVTYILDEPSIGLHARDQAKLIEVMRELCDRGNTVIVVEHDDATMRACDYLIDIGPKAGRFGGHVVFAGPPSEFETTKVESLTLDYLLGRKIIEIPKQRRSPDKGWITIKGARRHNLKSIDVALPLGCIVCVTGVSGSGKSTLINDILLPSLKNHIARRPIIMPYVDVIEGLETVDRVLEVDQKPIGRTPRSNPATYTKVFDLIRALYAALPTSRVYGYGPGRYSFNVSGSRSGRCESCSGAGVRTIEMKFLSNTYVTCEECGGKRFNDATLRVRYKGKNIADVLDMSFEDAADFFSEHPKIYKILQTVCDVGLSYVKLGQASPSLSGGEAQRMKLSKEIAKTSRTKTVFILDEPSTGLHIEDIRTLLVVLNRLADLGHSIVIIEHNLDIIKSADYLIDIGPEAGEEGGECVAAGSPEIVEKVKASHTGRFLKDLLK